ncbi:MAG: transporter, permease protein [Gaiellaceae bacterium]|jgi:ABC-type nitrate/sulfonate/bicarbonate transport system permease component|nr:transporter, permease protein [Gaiellaceae bacterium]
MSAAALGRLTRRLAGLGVLVAALGLWQAWAMSEDSFLVPTVSAVAERAWHVWPTADFLTSVAATLTRLAVGYAVGAGMGVAAGLLLGASRSTRRALEPLQEFLRSIPAIAIVPAAVVVLGLGDTTRIAVVAFAVFFPVLVNTIQGVRSVSPEARDTAAMLHVGPSELLLRVYLPAALPSIVAGLRVALGIGLVVVVISEFAVGGDDGLGRYILFQQTQYNVPEIYGGILFLGLLGYALNGLFLLVERRVLAWHHGAARESAR